MTKTRRAFLGNLLGVPFLPIGGSLASLAVPGKPLPVSCSSYDWDTFYRREGKSGWAEDLDASLTDFRKTGIQAIEPNLVSLEFTNRLIPFLKKYGILMPSAYVNSILHKKEEAASSMAQVLAIADTARQYGVKIIVTNPSPIRWGSAEVKSDAELREQARNLDSLGAALRERGITLAYHTHDTEMLAGAREFHHMLQSTSPRNVSFCFDTHWVYRGSQNSEVAVFDVLKMYGQRIAELHLRQSVDGVWSETFGEGDIDYRRFAEELRRMKIRPHLVIEQCIEAQSPNSINVVEAHQVDIQRVVSLFDYAENK